MAKHRYYYTHSEANFGKPIKTEVRGGSHLTCDIILLRDLRVYALRLPDGLHDGPKDALYFPHGLIRFGESVIECARRLSDEQAGVAVSRAGLFTMPSWVENDHWHMCLNVLAEIKDIPTPHDGISEVVEVTEESIPDEFGWWSVDQMRDVLAYLKTVAGSLPYK